MNFQMKNHIRPINNNIKHSTAYLWTTSPIIPGNIKTKRNVQIIISFCLSVLFKGMNDRERLSSE